MRTIVILLACKFIHCVNKVCINHVPSWQSPESNRTKMTHEWVNQVCLFFSDWHCACAAMLWMPNVMLRHRLSLDRLLLFCFPNIQLLPWFGCEVDPPVNHATQTEVRPDQAVLFVLLWLLTPQTRVCFCDCPASESCEHTQRDSGMQAETKVILPFGE